MLKFVILFREFNAIFYSKNFKNEEKNNILEYLCPQDLPLICNHFFSEFLEKNKFFDLFMNKTENIDEIIDIIQHFCFWLLKNEYTNFRLSIADQ